MSDNTTFSGEYIFSVVCGLTSVYLIQRSAPRTHPLIKFFLIPLSVTYLILLIVNTIAPNINNTFKKFTNYITDRTENNINSMGYIQIFPPLFAILIIFVILLYNHNFDQKKK